MSGMEEVAAWFEEIKSSLDQVTLAMEVFFLQRHEDVFHIFADADDDFEALAIELLEQCFRDIAFICSAKSGESRKHLWDGFSVIGIAFSNFKGHDLPFVIQHQMQFEAKELAHGGLSSFG